MTVMVKDNSLRFHGAGSAGPFTWTWRFLANTDLQVYRIAEPKENDPAQEVRTLLVEGVDYSVTGAGSYTGGTLTLTTALAAGMDLLVERHTEPLQKVGIRNQGNNFRPEVHEDVFDRQAMMIQDRDSDISLVWAVILYLKELIAQLAAGGSALLENWSLTFKPLDIITKGPWLDARAFASFEEAITAASAASKALMFSVDQSVTANLVIPVNVELLPLNGAVINHGAYTISYAGSTARWPLAQIFDGTGVVTGLNHINALWFGVKNDGVTENTAAAQRAFSSAYYTAAQSGWRVKIPRIHFPMGDYLFTQPDALFSGLAAGSFEITGEGKSYIGGRTNFIFTIPSYVAGQYFLKNSQIFGFTKFDGICFTATNGGNFMLMEGGGTGNAQNFRFVDCRWNGWTNMFEVTGTTMGSEVTFLNCSHKNFSGIGFIMNNPQAVNWRFYATDIEGFTGTLFSFIQGAFVLFSQGSVIPYDAAAKVFDIPTNAVTNSFGAGNAPHLSFQNTRFEIKTGAIMANKAAAAANVNFVVKFDGCGMGGLNIPTGPTPNMFEWYGAGTIKFLDCRNMANYRINWYGDGATITQYLNVIADNCDLPSDFVTASTFTLTNATGNTKVFPLFKVRNCNDAVNGEYRPVGGNSNGIIQSKHFVGFSATDNLAVCSSNTTFTVTIPPVKLTEIGVHPFLTAAYGAATATITVKNAAGTKTLATLTWTLNSPPAAGIIAQAMNYYVDAKNGDNLQVTFTTSYGGLVAFPGMFYLMY